MFKFICSCGGVIEIDYTGYNAEHVACPECRKPFIIAIIGGF